MPRRIIAGALTSFGIATGLITLSLLTERPEELGAAAFLGAAVKNDIGIALSAVLICAFVAVWWVAAYRPSTLRWVTAASIVYVFAALASLHFLWPELNPVVYVMSSYGLTPYAPIVQSAVLTVGLAQLALAAQIFAGSNSWKSLVVLVLVSISVAGCVVGAVYPMDPAVTPTTKAGRLHMLGGLMSFVPYAFIPVTTTFLFWRRWLNGCSRWLLGISAPIFVLSFSIVPLVSLGYAGLAQRLTIFLFCTWLVLAGLCFVAQDTASHEGGSHDLDAV